MIHAVRDPLDGRFEVLPDPLLLKVGHTVWRATARSSCATWRLCCAVAENEGVRTTIKIAGGAVLVILILPFVILGAIFR